MRWSIRYQLLIPLLTLLLGVVGISTWSAVASARRARRQIETQVGQVAQTLGEGQFRLTNHVLEMTKGLSGADYVLISAIGAPTTTLVERNVELRLPDFES